MAGLGGVAPRGRFARVAWALRKGVKALQGPWGRPLGQQGGSRFRDRAERTGGRRGRANEQPGLCRVRSYAASWAWSRLILRSLHAGRTEEIDRLIAKHETEIDKLEASVARLPKKVTLDTVLEPEEIVKLECERKVLVDAIKLTGYRAESSLARLIEPFFARYEDEARKFLKSIFQATADILPDESEGTLTIRFHGLASPRASRALAELCDLVSKSSVCYPGTDLRLRFTTLKLQK